MWRNEMGGAPESLPAGTWVIAENGSILGALCITPEGQHAVLDGVVVTPFRRASGLGTSLVTEAIASLPSVFGACPPERIPFYQRLGFHEITAEELPGEVATHMVENGDYPPDGSRRYVRRELAH